MDKYKNVYKQYDLLLIYIWKWTHDLHVGNVHNRLTKA